MRFSYFLYFVRQLIGLIFLLLPLLILFWATWRWARLKPKIGIPAWRSYVAIAAAFLAGLSAVLCVTSLIWAHVIGGFQFYDPILMRFYRWGFLTSAAGLITSLVGKGNLRWPSCLLSALMVFFWFAAAMGE
jgi:hypothetical protein